MRGNLAGGTAFAAVALIASCAPRAYGPAERRVHAGELAALIVEKYPATAEENAGSFAVEAFEVAASKREQWGVVLTPWLNNVLVNTGVNNRGLCYHWARDLYRELADDLPSGSRMTLIQSYRGQPLHEHHAISFHALDEHWSHGILLDAWRNAGNLKFGRIDKAKVPWQYAAEHP